MEVNVGKIIGKSGGEKWGQIHDFEPPDFEKKALRGHLTGVLSFSKTEGEVLPVVEEGREMLARLHERYFGAEGEGIEVLRVALNNIRDEFPGVEVGAVVVRGKELWVAGGQGVGIWVKRGNKEGWVIRSEEEEIKVLATTPKQGDIVIIGNRSFWSGVPEGLLVSAAGSGSEAAVETLAAAIHGKETTGGEAGSIIELKDGTEVENTENEGTEPVQETVKEPEVKKKRKLWEGIKIKLPIPTASIYVPPEDREKRRKRTMIVACLVFAALVILVAGGQVRSKKMAMENSETNKKIEEIGGWFDEAKSLSELNPRRSRQLLAQVEPALAELEQSKVKDDRLVRMRSQWGEVLGLVSGVRQVSLQEVVDLGLIRENMKGDKMAIDGKNIYILDTQSNRLVEVDIEKKSGKVIAGEEGLGKTKLLAVYPGKAEVWGDKGVVEWKGDKSSLAIVPDGEWGNIVGMKMFAGNIYLLDSGKGQIWRYGATETGFGTRQSWVGESGGADLTKARGFAIDGSVWVLARAGEQDGGGAGVIWKFTRGVREDWNPDGADDLWGEGAVIYTGDEITKIYVLDPTKERIIVWGKTGELEAQLTSSEFKSATDLVVDEIKGKAYIVAGSGVKEFSL
jgi:hypothetical protein